MSIEKYDLILKAKDDLEKFKATPKEQYNEFKIKYTNVNPTLSSFEEKEFPSINTKK